MNVPMLHSNADGAVTCDDGWAVRFVTPDTLEYVDGESTCLVNVDFVTSDRKRRIYASESSSEFFPHLRERLQAVAQHFKGRFEVV